MDKLELDGRVAQLERTVAILVGLNMLLFAAAGASVFWFSARSSPPPPMVSMTMPATERAVTVATAPAVPPSDGSVPFLSGKLEELKELHNRNLLTSFEFDAKKKELLGKPLASCNLTTDLEAISELRNQNILTSFEHDDLKKKILDTAK